nr:hypothetical protein [Tanacetum cinerariifolium]
ILLESTSNKLKVGDMEILLEPTSNKLIVERFDTSAGNHVKEILLKLNLPDHRILKDGGEEYQLADLFTKALGRDRIEVLIKKLCMRSFTLETLKQLTNKVDE